MKNLALALVLLAACSNGNSSTPAPNPNPAPKEPAAKPPVKRAEGLISFTAPSGWIEEEPENNLRKAQLKVPDKEKKAADALFVLSKFGPQEVEPNLQRWAGQMQCDVPEAEEIAAAHKTFFADFKGHYRSGETGDDIENARMLVAMVMDGDVTWFFKLTGHADTVGDWRDEFIAMLKGAK